MNADPAPPPLTEPAALLAGWEAAAAFPPVARSAALLHHFALADGVQAALNLPIGSLATRAATLFIRAFGPIADVLTSCTECGELMEVALDMRELTSSAPPTDAQTQTAPVSVALGDLLVRAPTTRDLLAISDASDCVTALLTRCLRHVDDRQLTSDELETLSAADLAAIDSTAERIASPALTMLRTRCPGCRAEVAAPIDVGALLWEQVAMTASSLLTEIAALAQAFGWSEQAVLDLTPIRRGAYLLLLTERASGPVHDPAAT